MNSVREVSRLNRMEWGVIPALLGLSRHQRLGRRYGRLAICTCCYAVKDGRSAGEMDSDGQCYKTLNKLKGWPQTKKLIFSSTGFYFLYNNIMTTIN